jgi:hypothetical protein
MGIDRVEYRSLVYWTVDIVDKTMPIVCAIELKFRAGIPTIPILFVESVSFLERFPL